MPTYEYQCKACGSKFERFQKMTDEPIKECPDCSGPAKRLISAGAGFIFKGSGFYITDYRSENYKQAEKKEKEAVSESKSDSKTESKGESPEKNQADGT